MTDTPKRIFAIDPGSRQSGWVHLLEDGKTVVAAGVDDNDAVLDLLHMLEPDLSTLVMERPGPAAGTMLAIGMLDKVKAQLQAEVGGDISVLAFDDMLRSAIQQIDAAQSRIGMAYKTSGDLVLTAFWYGAFAQAAGYTPDTVASLTRQQVKSAFHVRPGESADAVIRQRIIEHYGEGSERKGGALGGVKSHAWQALAVALAYVARGRK